MNGVPWMMRASPLLLLFGIALGSVAVDSPAIAAPDNDEFLQDLWFTVRARKLLLDDPQLAPLNIGVKVTRRVAILWGPIPSAALAIRAESRLRSMIELVAIVNRLSIIPEIPEGLPLQPQFLPESLPPAEPKPAKSAPRFELPGNGKKKMDLTSRTPPQEKAAGTPAYLAYEVGVPAGRVRLPYIGTISVPAKRP